jgi:hypothetical protein
VGELLPQNVEQILYLDCDILIVDDIDEDQFSSEDFYIEVSDKSLAEFHKTFDLTKSKEKCVMNVFGGLGNQLFQIATAISYSYEHDMELLVKPDVDNKRAFYWDSLLSSFKNRLTQDSYNKYIEPSLSYNQLPTPSESIELWGYFQSSKFFYSGLKKFFTHMLVFPDTIDKYISEKYGNLGDNFVIVHARRGDYVTNKLVHNPLSDSYYESAKKHIEEVKGLSSPLYILISDDQTYWTQSPVFQHSRFLVFNESDIVTLWLIMQSKHIIMANSTFSWWGAYLSSATNVIVPKDWFGIQGEKDWKDIYEDSWTKI